jgi:hypothetical protein
LIDELRAQLHLEQPLEDPDNHFHPFEEEPQPLLLPPSQRQHSSR